MFKVIACIRDGRRALIDISEKVLKKALALARSSSDSKECGTQTLDRGKIFPEGKKYIKFYLLEFQYCRPKYPGERASGWHSYQQRR